MTYKHLGGLAWQWDFRQAHADLCNLSYELKRKYKARFCVRGDRQWYGIGYEETYAPVVQWSTVRMMLTLTMKLGLRTKQVDYSNAFVQADIDVDVYCELPTDFRWQMVESRSMSWRRMRAQYRARMGVIPPNQREMKY